MVPFSIAFDVYVYDLNDCEGCNFWHKVRTLNARERPPPVTAIPMATV